MDLALWPYTKTEFGWSIPDEIVTAVWNSMVTNDRVAKTFYDGTVTDIKGFMTYFQSPRNFPVLVTDVEDYSPILWAWLNNVDDGVAYGHFSFLDKFSREAMKRVLKYWRYMPLEVVIGVTPESYSTLIKLLEYCGLTLAGKIPAFCNMVYEGRREAGVISYYEIGGQGNGKEIGQFADRSSESL